MNCASIGHAGKLWSEEKIDLRECIFWTDHAKKWRTGLQLKKILITDMLAMSVMSTFHWEFCWILLRALLRLTRDFKKIKPSFSEYIACFLCVKNVWCLPARTLFDIEVGGRGGFDSDVFRARHMNTNAHVHFPHIPVVFPRTKIQKKNIIHWAQ